MSEETGQELEAAKRTTTSIAVSNRGIEIRNLSDLLAMANYVVQSKMGADGETIPSAVIKMQCGMELGIGPMMAIQNIAAIGNRPVIWGDLVPALLLRSGQLEEHDEHFIGEFPSDKFAAVCTMTRKWPNGKTRTRTIEYSWADAKRAGLSGKKGPWEKDPKRMCLNRARTFCARDLFPDVLKGFATRDDVESGDMIDVTPDAAPEPANIEAIKTKLSEPRLKRAKAPVLDVEPVAESKPETEPVEVVESSAADDDGMF